MGKAVSTDLNFLTLLVAIHNPHSLHSLEVRDLVAAGHCQRAVNFFLEM